MSRLRASLLWFSFSLISATSVFCLTPSPSHGQTATETETIQAIKGDDAKARARAATALGRFIDNRSSEALRDAARDPDSAVRKAVLNAVVSQWSLLSMRKLAAEIQGKKTPVTGKVR